MSRTYTSEQRSDNRIDEVWMAEIGVHGASAICQSKEECIDVIDYWRKFRSISGGTMDDYSKWTIWCNGEYVIGN